MVTKRIKNRIARGGGNERESGGGGGDYGPKRRRSEAAGVQEEEEEEEEEREAENKSPWGGQVVVGLRVGASHTLPLAALLRIHILGVSKNGKWELQKRLEVDENRRKRVSGPQI